MKENVYTGYCSINNDIIVYGSLSVLSPSDMMIHLVHTVSSKVVKVKRYSRKGLRGLDATLSRYSFYLSNPVSFYLFFCFVFVFGDNICPHIFILMLICLVNLHVCLLQAIWWYVASDYRPNLNIMVFGVVRLL